MIPQSDPAWLKARVGLLTASSAGAMCDRTVKGALTKAAKDLALTKAVERTTGYSMPHYVTFDMERGIEREPDAIEAFEAETGIICDRGGLAVRVVAEGLTFGATPDRLIDEDGLVEAKCPRPNVQVGYFINGIPEDYYLQMQMQMLVMERSYNYFVSYCPEAPRDYALFIRKVSVNSVAFERLVKCGIELEKEIESISALLIASKNGANKGASA